ncbi:unnamed protein product [Trifolium pratense]|uniref:Uncharacterized protein n=1 Tax=Trifolium pratense TaxID=57577 RepID=A0ACB0L8W1_TRIPR|nr:unnamed protein product [Trifolium pratense]
MIIWFSHDLLAVMVARFVKMCAVPDLELNSRLENINAPEFLGVEKCGGDDCGRETIPIERVSLCNGNEDVEVNITECKHSGKAVVVQDLFEDLTVSSSSSSFGDTGSGSENAVAASFGDQEVESQMCADGASSSMCDDWHESLRKRKRRATTDHWKRFISPITRRCKWVELQLKQLQSQANKYEEELAALNHTKEHDFVHLTLDGTNIKSVPISGRMHRNKVMKRKRRERVEEKCDLASYMSNHTLLSYYEKKADHNVDVDLEDCQEVAVGGDIENLVEFTSSDDLWYPVDCYDNDMSWEATIQKLTAIQSQVQNLKSRYDKVISENPGRFCFVNQLSALEPSDGLNHSDLKPGSPAGNASSGDDRIVPFIEDTDRPEVDDLRDNVAKEELHELENVGNQLVKKIESIEENVAISEFQVSEPKSSVYAVHYTLRPCSTLTSNIPWNKGKGKKSGSKRKRISVRKV